MNYIVRVESRYNGGRHWRVYDLSSRRIVEAQVWRAFPDSVSVVAQPVVENSPVLWLFDIMPAKDERS